MAAGSIALSNGVAHPSNDSTVPVAGLSYRAHYNGDSIYNAADGPCETLTHEARFDDGDGRSQRGLTT